MDTVGTKNRLVKLCTFECSDVILYDIIGVGMQRLQTLIQSLLLRRTKEEIGSDGRPLVSLSIT